MATIPHPDARLTTRRRRPVVRYRERGQATLQHVIMAPAILLFLALATQTCLWYLARATALSAAQEGVRAGRADTTLAAAVDRAAQQSALAYTRNAGKGLLDQPATAVRSNATTIQVTVTGVVPSFVPGLTLTVSQVARGARERFTTPTSAATREQP